MATTIKEDSTHATTDAPGYGTGSPTITRSERPPTRAELAALGISDDFFQDLILDIWDLENTPATQWTAETIATSWALYELDKNRGWCSE